MLVHECNVSSQRLAIEISRNAITATRVPSGATLCGPTSSVTPLAMQPSQGAGDPLLNSNSSRSIETYPNGTSTRYIPASSSALLLYTVQNVESSVL